MNRKRRQAIKAMLALGGAAGLGISPAAVSATESTGSITLYVGFPAGGIPDMVARLLAEQLQKELGRVVVVVNRTGAGGQLAVQAIKNARPDGLSYMLSTPAALTVYPHVYDKLAYSVEDDLQPVASVCSYYTVLAVNNDVPVTTLAEFLDWCKENPEKALYGTPGIGTTLQFAGELLSEASGVPLQAVPYKGGPALTQAVVSGEITSSLNLSNNFAPLYKAGRVKLLAISSQERLADLPDVPTFAELGFGEVVIPEWMGVVANSKTPASEVALFHKAINEALESTGLKAALENQQCEPLAMSTLEFGELIQSTSLRWGDHIKKTGFKL